MEKVMLAGKSSFFLATVCGHAVEQKSSMMAGKQVFWRGSHYRLWKAKHIHAGRMYGKLRKESKYMLVANRANTS